MPSLRRLLDRGLSFAREAASLIAGAARDAVRSRSSLVVENAALRQQLAVLNQKAPKPKIRDRDRWFWIAMRRFHDGWRGALVIVKPETVIQWHRKGFRAYWRWLSKPAGGRPLVDAKIRAQIRRIANDNPSWGAPRIHAELLKLGFVVAEATVSRYMPEKRRPGPTDRQKQSWRTFLENHRPDIAAMDFLAVPLLSFRVIYVWFVIGHERRKIIHFGVTDAPTAKWVAQHLRDAFPFDTAPKYVICDNDPLFAAEAQATIRGMAIKAKKITPRSPWQNGVAERFVGNVRRELLDHVVPLSEGHLRRLVQEYVRYYNEDRCHLALDKDAPISRSIDPGPPDAEVIALPRLGGLHHRYERRKAA